jgi:hypothetical protein
MKALKWIGIGFGGLAAVAAGIFALAFLLTAGAARATDEFLALVGQERYEEAYKAATPEFQKQTSLEDFRATMKRMGVDKYESAAWTSREIDGGRTKIEGTVRLRDGRKLLMAVGLVKIGDTWRVYGMDMRQAAS